MTRPITGAVLGVMWRRILERLFPKLRPALKAPEALYPNYPRFVLAARGPDGEFPVTQFSDGEIWVLVSTDPEKLAEQAHGMNKIGMVPTTNLMLFDHLRDIVANQIPHAKGIAVLDSREEYANLIYTR